MKKPFKQSILHNTKKYCFVVNRLLRYARNDGHSFFFAFIVLLLSFSSTTAQNLIPNGSFEECNCIPKKVAEWNCAKDWYPGNAGTPDVYNRASPSLVAIPENNIGTQEAHQGNAYGGLILLDQYEGIVEYFGTKLTQPLVKDKQYYFFMYVSLAEKSKFGISSIGAYFTTEKVNKAKWEPIYVTPQIANNIDSILYDTHRWCKIDGTFTAAGGEQYLTIGNFTREDHIKRQQINYEGVSDVLSYYFLDDVSLTKVKDASDSIQAPKAEVKPEAVTQPTTEEDFVAEEALKPGASFELKNIYFDFNESTLLPASFSELDKLKLLLDGHSTMRIELRGHTDNKGVDAQNNRLSTLRARAVVEYLTSKGINANRLRYKGFGSKLPVTTNATDKGRSQNRRVEFVIVQL